MGNKEQVAILRQGVAAWNAWRESHPNVEIDLQNTDLSSQLFIGFNFRRARFDGADLSFSHFVDIRAWNARFNSASLYHATITRGNFEESDLSNARLTGAAFATTYLKHANFRGAILSGTILANLSLTSIFNLDHTNHGSPSSISLDTLELSLGRIPENFLRGCGLSDIEIEFAKLYREDLTLDQITEITYRIHELRGTRPIQLNPVFISYAHKDGAFVDELEKRLNNAGIRFWRDIHDLKAGRLETQIDRAIRFNPVVILVLSQHSVESDWVEYEASKARALEKELKRDVLCPVALDDSWKSCSWPGPLRRQIEDYNVLDFSKDIDKQFAKLKDGLRLFYPRQRAVDPIEDAR
ncbi:MAG TPA: toll/interleukin-1 receptor domain-containing protein [Thermoanaerobaculia bacterium]|nr:toll/interleukin-1 receptor domain-containing protein [Thermoanaerobaculia bacterium]